MKENSLDLGKFSHYIKITTTEQQDIYVNPNDRYIGKELINNNIWEKYIVNLLKDHCKDGMNVIDVGANIGSHTILMSKLVGSNGKVYAFEPCKNHYEILFHNLMINNCFNTIIYNCGCSDTNENMYISSEFLDVKQTKNFGAITLKKEFENGDEIVQNNTIDSYNFSNIDVVKLDAEYMENKVLIGMKDTILKCKPIIIIEIHNEQLENITSILNSMDYSLNKIGNTWDYVATPNK
jgi:FkbM family methyltransferase